MGVSDVRAAQEARIRRSRKPIYRSLCVLMRIARDNPLGMQPISDGVD
jgi:hypothetical protein